jgi:hypothetical protein
LFSQLLLANAEEKEAKRKIALDDGRRAWFAVGYQMNGPATGLLVGDMDRVMSLVLEIS